MNETGLIDDLKNNETVVTVSWFLKSEPTIATNLIEFSLQKIITRDDLAHDQSKNIKSISQLGLSVRTSSVITSTFWILRLWHTQNILLKSWHISGCHNLKCRNWCWGYETWDHDTLECVRKNFISDRKIIIFRQKIKIWQKETLLEWLFFWQKEYYFLVEFPLFRTRKNSFPTKRVFFQTKKIWAFYFFDWHHWRKKYRENNLLTENQFV